MKRRAGFFPVRRFWSYYCIVIYLSGSAGCFRSYLLLSSQNATALAAATFRESTPWYMGIFTV